MSRPPDPVYPFGTQQAVPMPPFIDAGTGLEVTGLRLAVKLTDPLTSTANGGLSLKLGSGVGLNSAGALTASGFAKTKDPVYVTPQSEIALRVGTGLTVNAGGELTAAPINVVPPLAVNNRSQLELTLGNGLRSVAGTLSLQVQQELQLSSTGLGVKVVQPLELGPAGISLSLAEPLGTNAEGRLCLNLGTGLSVIDGSLTLSSKKRLRSELDRSAANSPTGPQIIAASPLEMNTTYEPYQISIQIGEGLTTKNGKLIAPNNTHVEVAIDQDHNEWTFLWEDNGGVYNLSCAAKQLTSSSCSAVFSKISPPFQQFLNNTTRAPPSSTWQVPVKIDGYPSDLIITVLHSGIELKSTRPLAGYMPSWTAIKSSVVSTTVKRTEMK